MRTHKAFLFFISLLLIRFYNVNADALPLSINFLNHVNSGFDKNNLNNYNSSLSNNWQTSFAEDIIKIQQSLLTLPAPLQYACTAHIGVNFGFETQEEKKQPDKFLLAIFKERENEITKFPDSLQLRLSLAKDYINYNLYNEAKIHYKQIIKKDSTNLTALNNLGNIFFIEGKIDSAQNYYFDALKLAQRPEKDNLNFNLALTYKAIGDDSLGFELMQQVVNAIGIDGIKKMIKIDWNIKTKGVEDSEFINDYDIIEMTDPPKKQNDSSQGSKAPGDTASKKDENKKDKNKKAKKNYLSWLE